METNIKKVTKATFKAFIRKNEDKIFIRVDSSFNGVDDCLHFFKNQFQPAQPAYINCDENTCGLAGVWLVGGTRNNFSNYEDDQYVGITFSNCCQSGVVAIKNRKYIDNQFQVEYSL